MCESADFIPKSSRNLQNFDVHVSTFSSSVNFSTSLWLTPLTKVVSIGGAFSLLFSSKSTRLTKTSAMLCKFYFHLIRNVLLWKKNLYLVVQRTRLHDSTLNQQLTRKTLFHKYLHRWESTEKFIQETWTIFSWVLFLIIKHSTYI